MPEPRNFRPDCETQCGPVSNSEKKKKVQKTEVDGHKTLILMPTKQIFMVLPLEKEPYQSLKGSAPRFLSTHTVTWCPCSSSPRLQNPACIPITQGLVFLWWNLKHTLFQVLAIWLDAASVTYVHEAAHRHNSLISDAHTSLHTRALTNPVLSLGKSGPYHIEDMQRQGTWQATALLTSVG